MENQTTFKIKMPCQTHAVASAESLSQDSAPALDPAADSQQLRASQLVWDVNTGEELVGKPKKRQYTEEEQAEVTKNRGKVCEYHRRTKKKVCAVRLTGDCCLIEIVRFCHVSAEQATETKSPSIVPGGIREQIR
jgi:hypothetical protein